MMIIAIIFRTGQRHICPRNLQGYARLFRCYVHGIRYRTMCSCQCCDTCCRSVIKLSGNIVHSHTKHLRDCCETSCYEKRIHYSLTYSRNHDSSRFRDDLISAREHSTRLKELTARWFKSHSCKVYRLVRQFNTRYSRRSARKTCV